MVGNGYKTMGIPRLVCTTSGGRTRRTRAGGLGLRRLCTRPNTTPLVLSHGFGFIYFSHPLLWFTWRVPHLGWSSGPSCRLHCHSTNTSTFEQKLILLRCHEDGGLSHLMLGWSHWWEAGQWCQWTWVDVTVGTVRRTSDVGEVGWVGNQSSSEAEEELGTAA